MNWYRDCNEKLSEKDPYFCRILMVTRQAGEEQICAICEQLSAAVRQDVYLQQAFLFAAEAHRGQYRKGTKIPYLIHLIRTWGYVQRMSADKEEQAASLLHDVLEDTDVTESELQQHFGTGVRDLVAGESECKRGERPAADTWKLRKSETIRKLEGRLGKEHERRAMRIAMADKLANLYSMAYEYRRVGDRLWKKFNQTDKKMHGWYYGKMGNIFETYFKGKAESVLVSEYKAYYREIFNHEIDTFIPFC